MTARFTMHTVGGLLLGVVGAWLLGIATSSLLVPLAALLVVAAVAWRHRYQVLATSVALGAACTTLFFTWLFATLGDGLAGM